MCEGRKSSDQERKSEEAVIRLLAWYKIKQNKHHITKINFDDEKELDYPISSTRILDCSHSNSWQVEQLANTLNQEPDVSFSRSFRIAGSPSNTSPTIS